MTQRHLSQPDTTIRQSMLAELDADAYKLTCISCVSIHRSVRIPTSNRFPTTDELDHRRWNMIRSRASLTRLLLLLRHLWSCRRQLISSSHAMRNMNKTQYQMYNHYSIRLMWIQNMDTVQKNRQYSTDCGSEIVVVVGHECISGQKRVSMLLWTSYLCLLFEGTWSDYCNNELALYEQNNFLYPSIEIQFNSE